MSCGAGQNLVEVHAICSNHRNSRTRMLGPSRDILILWVSKMVLQQLDCKIRSIERTLEQNIAYFEVPQRSTHRGRKSNYSHASQTAL